jgi:hypothetical protein
MSKQQTKELTVKTQAMPPAVYQETASVVDSSDIIVPRLLLAQGLSVAVADGKAKMGDITNSLTGVVVGGDKKPIEFIPITLKKYWRTTEKVGSKKQYRGTEPFTAANAGRALTEMLPSRANPNAMSEYEHNLVIDVFGFTEEDVQDPIAMPTAISFTRTSYKAGQQVNTHFATLDGALEKMPYYTYYLQLSCDKKQNDQGIFYVFGIKPAIENGKYKKTPASYYPKIDRWSKILSDKTRSVVIDDAGENDSSAATEVDASRF